MTRTRLSILAASVAAIVLAIAPQAMAWPAPQPGKPACLPNLDANGNPNGTFHIDQAAQAPFPTGSHQPENGKCEGPVTPTPVPVPVPPASCGTTATCPPGPAGPQGPAGPAGPTVYVPVPTPVPTEKVCTSRRTIRFLVRERYPGVSNTQGDPIIGIAKRGVFTGNDTDGQPIKTTWTRTKTGRIQVTIQAAEHRFTGFDNDLRTTVWAKVRLPDGRTQGRRLIYRSAVCRSQQGNPNDDGARAPVIPSKAS